MLHVWHHVDRIHCELVSVHGVQWDTFHSMSDATARMHNSFLNVSSSTIAKHPVDVQALAWTFRGGCAAVCPVCFDEAVQDVPAAQM